MLAQVQPVDTPEIVWSALVPLLFLVGGAVLLLTIASLVPKLPSWLAPGWTIAAAAGSIIAVIPNWDRVQDDGPFSTGGGALGIDGFGLFLTVVIAGSVILTTLLTTDYLRREELDTGVEAYVLLLLSASGGVVMAMANDLIVLFLGLEILSIAIYILAAMHRRRIQSQEAGLKYFVLGAFSSAFFLYGIAMVYGATGSTNLVTIKDYLSSITLTTDSMLLAGFGLLLVGLGFKVAAVPFHSWSPDVYQGSPSPIVAFMASGVKAAGFAAILRVFVLTFGDFRTDWQPVVYVLAILSLLVGAVAGIVQRDVKRMLAYSSINHAGFMLVGVEAASDRGTAAVLFYAASYAALVAGTFGVVTLVGRRGDGRHDLDDYRGLAAEKPVLALSFTLLLMAQLGAPFTSGFFAKFSVLSAAIDARSYWLALVAMLSAVVSAYIYLRLVFTLYTDRPPLAEGEERTPIRVPWTAGLAVAIAVVITIGIGIVPGPLDDVARDAVPALVELAG
jgi:NADH-quinone oxidoreductase subunit N